MNVKVSIYLRSVKGQRGLSIDYQRSQLQWVAKVRKFQIVQEFVDLIDYKTQDPGPGFSMLRDALARPDREWLVIMFYNSNLLSSISKETHWLKVDARKYGVSIIYPFDSERPSGKKIIGL